MVTALVLLQKTGVDLVLNFEFHIFHFSWIMCPWPRKMAAGGLTRVLCLCLRTLFIPLNVLAVRRASTSWQKLLASNSRCYFIHYHCKATAHSVVSWICWSSFKFMVWTDSEAISYQWLINDDSTMYYLNYTCVRACQLCLGAILYQFCLSSLAQLYRLSPVYSHTAAMKPVHEKITKITVVAICWVQKCELSYVLGMTLNFIPTVKFTGEMRF